jgi:hypothetical protein
VDSSPPSLDNKALHALSNHLAVILGFIELVLQETPPEDARRSDLLEIRDAAVQAAEVLGRRPRPEDTGR